MRVAYDWGPLLGEPTGVGRYAAELARPLERLGVDLVRYAIALRGRRISSIKRWRAPSKLLRASWKRWEKPPIERLVGPVDLVHATNFVLPARRSTPGVVTVHDLSFYRDDTFPGGEALRDLVPWSVERAARVLVPTDAIAQEVIARWGVSRSKVVTTYEGVGSLFFGATPLAESVLASLGIMGPFVLSVGTLEPRKNLATLLRAWDARRAGLGGRQLVLAGPSGWGENLPRVPNVVFTGWVGDETLPGLLAAADAFCYPSLYEGFGLPPLEAMAAGTPVVAGRYSAAPEVLGDAARLVDPLNETELGDALVEVLDDVRLRRRLIMLGRAQAAGYTWERTASATMDAYKEAMGST